MKTPRCYFCGGIYYEGCPEEGMPGHECSAADVSVFLQEKIDTLQEELDRVKEMIDALTKKSTAG